MVMNWILTVLAYPWHLTSGGKIFKAGPCRLLQVFFLRHCRCKVATGFPWSHDNSGYGWSHWHCIPVSIDLCNRWTITKSALTCLDITAPWRAVKMPRSFLIKKKGKSEKKIDDIIRAFTRKECDIGDNRPVVTEPLLSAVAPFTPALVQPIQPLAVRFCNGKCQCWLNL